MDQQPLHLHHHQQHPLHQQTPGVDDCPLVHKTSHGVYVKKSNKPLMEKRRRERINTCLDQLKAILMDVTKKESSYYSKLEKADILEMTVKYLHSLKHHRVAGSKSTAHDEAYKYVAGYNECAAQVTHFLTSLQTNADVSMATNDNKQTTMTTTADDARCCLLEHLANSLGRATSAAGTAGTAVPVTAPTPAESPASSTSSCLIGAVDQLTSSSFPPPTVYVINPQQVPVTSSTDHAHIPSQLRLLPARLSSGELVLLLAGSPDKLENGTCRTEEVKLEVTDAKNGCDIISRTEPCVSTSCCGNDVTSRPPCKSEHDNRKSASVVGDDSNVTDDASMWRPW